MSNDPEMSEWGNPAGLSLIHILGEPMKAELIAVGTEILTGQITNTNAQFLSEKLAELGIDVYFHTAVGDNEKRLLSVLDQASKRSDLVIPVSYTHLHDWP